MAKIVGVGGVFVGYEAPEAARAWYRDVLGVEFEAWGGTSFEMHAGDRTVFSTFPAASAYFAPSTRGFMINFIVADLDGLLARAAAAGVQPLGREDQDQMGRFAWLLDPAGVKIELWEPPAA